MSCTAVFQSSAVPVHPKCWGNWETLEGTGLHRLNRKMSLPVQSQMFLQSYGQGNQELSA